MEFHDFLERQLKEGSSVKNVAAIDDRWLLERGAVFNNPPFDFLLIGGEPVASRTRWVADAKDLVKQGGWVMLGNANRPEYAEQVAALKKECSKVETFDFNEGGSKYRVVEFYKVKGPARKRRKAKKDENRTEPEQD